MIIAYLNKLFLSKSWRKEVFVMSRFMDIAIQKQYESVTVYQATKNLEKSCNLCCYHGYHLSCRHCHIEGAHETVIKMLTEKKTA